jgi:hypothetical protein
LVNAVNLDAGVEAAVVWATYRDAYSGNDEVGDVGRENPTCPALSLNL